MYHCAVNIRGAKKRAAEAPRRAEISLRFAWNAEFVIESCACRRRRAHANERSQFDRKSIGNVADSTDCSAASYDVPQRSPAAAAVFVVYLQL